MNLRNDLGKPPRARQRLMHAAVRIRLDEAFSTVTYHRRSPLFVHQEVEGHGFVDHPLQRDLRQAALELWVTAAHVAMDAGKPDLLQVLWTSFLRRCRRPPKVGSEERAAFVYRYRMPPVRDERIVRAVGESELMLDPAHGTDRIPDPDQMGPASTHGVEGFAKLACELERHRSLALGRQIDRGQHPDGVGNERLIALRQQAIHAKQRRYCTHRVCAATEAEHIKAVIWLEVVHQEHVRITHVGLEAASEGESEPARYPPCHRAECSRRLHRAEAWMIVYDLSFRVLDEAVVQLEDVGAIDGEFIRSAVAAQHYVSWHPYPP